MSPRQQQGPAPLSEGKALGPMATHKRGRGASSSRKSSFQLPLHLLPVTSHRFRSQVMPLPQSSGGHKSPEGSHCCMDQGYAWVWVPKVCIPWVKPKRKPRELGAISEHAHIQCSIPGIRNSHTPCPFFRMGPYPPALTPQSRALPPGPYMAHAHLECSPGCCPHHRIVFPSPLLQAAFQDNLLWYSSCLCPTVLGGGAVYQTPSLTQAVFGLEKETGRGAGQSQCRWP